tara:strand:- start:10 stop:456 length:447 start_codon:yes stop_codon:yes gene_type:complete
MASLITEQPKSENDKVDPDFQELLDEFKESKNKEEAAAAMKASLPAMERQRSAPLWDQMLNPGKDGKVDPNKFAERLSDGKISYEEAVTEARNIYEKKQKSSKKTEGGRRKTRKKRRKKKRKTKKRRKRKKRKTFRKKRFRNQRGCKR